MTSVRVAFVLIFAVVQLCTAEYVVYGQKMTLDNNLSLNSNRCHHPLITQLRIDYPVDTQLMQLRFEACPWTFQISNIFFVFFRYLKKSKQIFEIRHIQIDELPITIQKLNFWSISYMQKS